jgi:hypothetical protein
VRVRVLSPVRFHQVSRVRNPCVTRRRHQLVRRPPINRADLSIPRLPRLCRLATRHSRSCLLGPQSFRVFCLT